MYTSTDFISITEVRKNLSGVIDNLGKNKQKIIFRNNKPTAVLIDFYYFEELEKNSNNDFLVEEIAGSEEFIGTKQHNELLALMKSA